MNSPTVFIDAFTRQETIDLTGFSSNALSYIEAAGVIIPTRIGHSSKPSVFFSWDQLIAIRLVKAMRRSLKDKDRKAIQAITQFITTNGVDDSNKSMSLAMIGDELHYVSEGTERLMGQAILGLARGSEGINSFPLIIVPAIAIIVDEIWDAAENSFIDMESFKQRAKATRQDATPRQ